MSTNIASSHAASFTGTLYPIGLILGAFRFVWRTSFFLLLVFSFFTVTGFITLTIPSGRRQAILMSASHFFSKAWNWGFNVRLSHRITEWEQGTFLVVGNHLSYLDIPAVSAMIPCQFITSVEIKNTPLLGHICRLAACLFVERRNPSRINEEANEIKTSLEAGLNVTIFPEGTSSNGSHILPFKKRLLNSAIGTNARILPICINYTHINGKSVDGSNRDLVCWYGDMGFFNHFIRFLCLKSVDIEISVGPSFSPTDADDHRYIANRSQQIISSNFIPISSRSL